MRSRIGRKSALLMGFRSIVLGSFLIFLNILLPHPAKAVAPGDLDLSFDTDGKVTTDFATSHDCAHAVALQSDGKIVVGGSSGFCTSDADNFALARYNTDGSLDTTFGTSGKVTTDFLGLANEIRGLAIQPDGKIVAAGWTHVSGSNYNFALARYNANGSLDTTFGSGGKVNTDFTSGSEDAANAIAIQTDGKIVVVGYSILTVSPFTHRYALARYNTNGSLDTSFDGDGRVINDFVYFDQAWYALAIQPNSKIVTAGAGGSGQNDFTLARYNSNGSLDTTFGSSGKTTTDFGGADSSYAVRIQFDGKIVAAGAYAFSGNTDFALARYNTNGTLDTTFDSDGKVTTDFGSPFDEGHAVAIQGDGKIIAAGRSWGQAGSSGLIFALARYNTNGSLDTTFGTGGKVITNLNSQTDVIDGIAVEWDGKLVAAGYSYNGSNYDFALVRYWLTSCP